jgi:hypothetical protein
VGLVYLFLNQRKAIAEVKTLIGEVSTELTLKISTVNGDEMRKASDQFSVSVKTMMRCLNRMELAALAIGDMAKALVSESALPASTLPAEAYAEPDAEGGRYITQSDAAKRDAATLDDM